jgi:hypothetical protein
MKSQEQSVLSLFDRLTEGLQVFGTKKLSCLAEASTAAENPTPSQNFRADHAIEFRHCPGRCLFTEPAEIENHDKVEGNNEQ